MFVVADDSTVTVLNLANRDLPKAVKRTLRELAERDPRRFVDRTGSTYQDVGRDVQIGPTGILIGNHKIGNLEDVVETITRTSLQSTDSITRSVRATKRAKITIGVSAIGGVVLWGFLYWINHLQ